ncbi:hypothetical protein C0J52_14845 [Blattella germanica]|nr:hypothetical protein C0J52_14845 [Blattella germanica]
MTIRYTALTIWSTGRWNARISSLISWGFRLCLSAICERISSEARWTRTCWNVIYYITSCILTTSSRARILTFISNTCLSSLTFSIKNAFWSAGLIWISYIFWQTFTYTSRSVICIQHLVHMVKDCKGPSLEVVCLVE